MENPVGLMSMAFMNEQELPSEDDLEAQLQAEKIKSFITVRKTEKKVLEN